MKFRNVILAAVAVLFFGVSGDAQNDSLGVGNNGGLELSVDDNSPWIAPVITDEMTKDPEQNRQYRLGQYKYSAQPKHMWELGVHSGHFFIDGDVDRRAFAGIGAGIHLRKALTYFTSIRFDGFFGRTRGLEKQPYRHRTNGGGLVESNNTFTGWDGYDGSNPDAIDWFPSHETEYYYGAIQLIFNIGNVLFHKERNKWNTYVGIGLGLDHHETKLDLLDGQGEVYTNLREQVGFTRQLFNTNAGRSAIAESLDQLYDGVYETEGFKKVGIFRIGDDFNIHPIFTTSLGVSRKLTRRLNIGLEHQVIASDNDYLDGIKFRSSTDQSNSVDVAHYTNLRLGFNLGKFSKRIEPLYWVNPMETVFKELAEVKSRPAFEWNDEDNDGVLDLIDQEPDTPEGCLVDTKGVTLDSDGDGVVDCRDKEPHSPPGYPVDEDGVAQIEDGEIDILTEEDVITIINQNCDACQNGNYSYQPGTNTVLDSQGRVLGTGQSNDDGTTTVTREDGTTTTLPTNEVISNDQSIPSRVSGGLGTTNNPSGTIGRVIHTGCGNWFLPMINFDLDKYELRPEAYVSLHQIAGVMERCPELVITAHGHTDVRNSGSYNNMLSYNRAKEAVDYLVSRYGIDRSRINLMFGGEDDPIIPNLKNNHYTTHLEEQMQFINRRVEFRISETADVNMERPAGRNAGVKSHGSSRPGSKYIGNKNSGY